MPKKIVPVLGVPPHQWHKHQPPGDGGDTKQENMAPHEQSVDATTESIIRQDSDIPMEPKTKKVPIKQWTTTANDPGRLHRLMPGGYTPLRAAPKLKEAAEYGGRLLYPHEVVAAFPRDPSPESELPEHYQPARVQPEEAQSTGNIGPWRDFAAKPESFKNYPQLQKVPVSKPMQSQHQGDRETTTSRGDRMHDGVHTGNTESPGPHKQSQKENGPFGSDNNHAPASLHRQEGAKPAHLGAYPQAEKHYAPVPSSEDSGTVAPAPMRDPDLKNLHVPRPNRNYAASVRSMVSVLSLKEDDNACGDHYADGSPVKHGDIRSKIGLEHSLHVSGGKLINTDIWMEKARKPEEIFLNPVYANPWIEDYVENQTDYDVCADFLYKEDPIVHCHRDVNTFSGKLLKPVQYDYTVPDYMDSDSTHRQMTSSASLYVQQKTVKPNFRNKNSGQPRRAPVRVNTPPPPSPAPEAAPAPQKQSLPVQRPRAETSPDPFAPRVPCHLRPATRDDMEGVRAIYNWEVLNGIQALDTEPLSLADWEGILKKSQKDKLPFVVAIRGPYQYQGTASQDDAEPVPREELTGKALAFGFLTIRQPGLAGSSSGTSRMSAKAHVFVHPGYRRKKLGHVCLDKLLSTVSTRYATKEGYDFVNIDDNPTYKYPRHHDRKIYSVFVEYFVPRIRERAGAKFSPDETDLKWFERVITSRYGFWKVARLEAAHRSRTTYEPAPIWLDTVMFEHMCQEGLDFTYEF